MAATDPLAAIHWAEGLEVDSAWNEALLGIASAWARTQPEAATRWAGNLAADNPVRAEAMKSALSYWLLEDASAAGRFVQTLPEVDQADAIESVAPALAQNNAADALDWAQRLPNANARQIALREVVGRWADNQPEEAARWALAEPESAVRVEHIRIVTTQWLAGDPENAARWVQTLAGPARDAAVDLVADELASQNPAQAVSWAESIGTPELRNTRLEDVATAWLKTDPSAARTWLASANLPTETKARLLTQYGAPV
jgi:hypothetical protein